MKLIITLLPVLINAQYQIETLTNPLLPIHQGTSYIITSHHHIYYHVNLTNIKNCLELTKGTLLHVNKILGKLNSTVYHLLTTRTQDLLDQSQSIESFLDHYTTPQKRPKRGLLNFIGKTHKYLYGTLDADDGERYDNYIRTLQNNQETLHQDITSTQTVLKELTENIDTQLTIVKTNQQKLMNHINELTQMTQTSSTTMYIIMLLDNLENNLRVINEIRTNVQVAINFAEINIMHHSILKYQELQNIISKFNPKTRIPFDNIIKYYEIAHADVTIKKDLIIFYIAIPLIFEKPYTLYHVYPIPVNGQITAINNPYLLKSNSDFYNSRENCQKIEDIFLCPTRILNKNEPCVSETINLTNHCPMIPIKYRETSVTQLDDNSIIVIPKSQEKVDFQCPNQNSIESISKPVLILPLDCIIKIKNKYYDAQKAYTINLRLKLPSINIDEKLVQDIEPLELKEIDLNSIHEDLRNVKNLVVHPLSKFSVISNSVSITFIIIVIIIIILLIIFLYYYYCRRNKKSKDNVKVDIELKPFENKPLFSQT